MLKSGRKRLENTVGIESIFKVHPRVELSIQIPVTLLPRKSNTWRMVNCLERCASKAEVKWREGCWFFIHYNPLFANWKMGMGMRDPFFLKRGHKLILQYTWFWQLSTDGTNLLFISLHIFSTFWNNMSKLAWCAIVQVIKTYAPLWEIEHSHKTDLKAP